jgi:hypothetical protein
MASICTLPHEQVAVRILAASEVGFMRDFGRGRRNKDPKIATQFTSRHLTPFTIKIVVLSVCPLIVTTV